MKYLSKSDHRKRYKDKNVAKIMIWLLAIILLYVFGFVTLSYTLVNPFLVFGLALGIGMFLSMPVLLIRRELKGSFKTKIIRIFVYLVTSTAFILAVLTSINYFGRDIDNAKTVKGKIEKVYSEQRYRKRRVGNRYYSNGEPYKEYFVVISLPSGKEKTFPISTETYNKYAVSKRKYSRNDSTNIKISHGALGWDVIDFSLTLH